MTQIVPMPLSVRDLDRFTPPGAEGEGAPVYLIRPASYLQRACWLRDVATAGARWTADEDLHEAMEAAIEATGAANAAALLEVVRAVARDGANVVREVAVEYAALLATLAREDPAVAALIAAREHHWRVAPWWAARRFLVGWENVALAFVRRGDLVPEDLIEQLPPDHLMNIGLRAIALTSPTAAARKNF